MTEEFAADAADERPSNMSSRLPTSGTTLAALDGMVDDDCTVSGSFSNLRQAQEAMSELGNRGFAADCLSIEAVNVGRAGQTFHTVKVTASSHRQEEVVEILSRHGVRQQRIKVAGPSPEGSAGNRRKAMGLVSKGQPDSEGGEKF